MEKDLECLEQKIRFVKENKLLICPDEIARGLLNSTKITDIGCLQHYASSYINLQGTLQECKIREFTAEIELVYSIAYQELKAIEVLKSMNIKHSYFGFNIVEFNNHVNYLVFTKIYKNPLHEIQLEEKFDIIAQLAIILYKMHRCECFLGPFDENSIVIDQEFKLILDELFFAFSPKIISGDYKVRIKFINNERQVAPEIELMKLNQNLNTTNINYESIDTFSFGLYAMKALNLDLPGFSLSGDPQSIFNEIVGERLNIIFECSEFFQAQIAERLKRQFSGFTFIEVFKDCLKFSQRLRINKIFILLTEWPYIRITNTNNTDESKISSAELEELVTLFGKTMSKSYKRKSNKKTFHDFVKNALQRILSKKETLFSKAIKSFFGTKCYSQTIKCRDGIVYFIWTLCKNIRENIENSYVNWIEGFTKLDYIPSKNYKNLLYNILNFDDPIQDYVITGLSAQTYETDWSYFFPTRIDHITFSYYQRLIDCPNIYQEFLSCLSHPRVKSIIKETVHVPEIDEENFFLEKVFPRVYLLKIQSSLHGLTTYNQNIFINSYAINLSTPEYRCKGAIFLTLFHELCHFFRRFKCQTFKQAKSIYTPKSSSSSDLKNSLPYRCENEMLEDYGDDGRSLVEMTEHEIHKNRGEAGDVLYEQLFDSRIMTVNDHAGKYLLRADFNDLEKFARVFNIENNKGGISVSIAKGSNKFISFKGLRCGMKMDSFK